MVKFRPEILDELAAFGVRPKDDTRPALVRAYLSDLYRYEIRSLRARLLAGDVPKQDYVTRVLELRKRYPLLAVPIALWTYR